MYRLLHHSQMNRLCEPVTSLMNTQFALPTVTPAGVLDIIPHFTPQNSSNTHDLAPYMTIECHMIHGRFGAVSSIQIKSAYYAEVLGHICFLPLLGLVVRSLLPFWLVYFNAFSTMQQERELPLKQLWCLPSYRYNNHSKPSRAASMWNACTADYQYWTLVILTSKENSFGICLSLWQ